MMMDRVDEMKGENALETAMTRALERQPDVMVPEDFAARVRASLPPQPTLRARRSVGHSAAVVGAAALLVALCWIAPHARPSFDSLAFDMELLMMTELAGVSAWLAMRREN